MAIPVVMIVGPTATGKTDLAIKLSQIFPLEIISADSRQVYQGLDVITGKDIPPDAYWVSVSDPSHPIFPGYYQLPNTRLYGYDLIAPAETFSVSQFVAYANRVIQAILESKKLPVIVGGTGLYVQSLINPPETLSIKPNPKLRSQLQEYSLEKLQHELRQRSPQKFNSLNHSDRHNPRRLIRAIEVQLAKSKESLLKKPDYHSLGIALMPPKTELDSKINRRVSDRVERGIKKGAHVPQAILT